MELTDLITEVTDLAERLDQEALVDEGSMTPTRVGVAQGKRVAAARLRQVLQRYVIPPPAEMEWSLRPDWLQAVTEHDVAQ